jgi:multiple sugar transport system ATP-binding protein
MAHVRLEDVTKLYGTKTAVNNVSFDCKEGEFFSIIGPAGAGKTTILKMVAGIEEITSGTISFDNRPVNELPPQERDVAMAFETYNLYPHFSVYENIAFPLRAPRRTKSLSPKQEGQRVEEIAHFLGIIPLLKRRPTELSGGEKQRVCLARVMVRKPRVFLLDEPIAHLDARLKFSTQTALKKLSGQLGTTIIYVTHDYREALGLSDRVAVLRKGVIEQIGTPEDVYHTPSTDFVARFIGDPPMNLIDGEVITRDQKTFFAAGDDFTIQLQRALRASAEEAARQEGDRRPVRLGIRSSHITVSRERISDNSFQLPVYAIARSPQGPLCTFELRDSFLQANIREGVLYDMSEKLWVDFDQDHLLFFVKTMEISKK